MKKVFLVLMVLGLVVAFTGTAFADSKCKDVKIKVKNSYKSGNNSVKIKVLAVNYYDKEDAKWRDNDMKNTEISYGSTKSITEDLEYVGNEWVKKIQVKFKFKEDKNWSSEKWSNVVSFSDHDCVKGKSYSVTVSGTTSKK